MSTLPARPDAVAIQEFAAKISGQVILAKDQQYDEARKVYNAMINKRPAIIVKCNDVADVIQSVQFGRDSKLPVAVRGGGHNGGGLGLVDDGLVIDLSGIKFVRVDTKEQHGACGRR